MGTSAARRFPHQTTSNDSNRGRLFALMEFGRIVACEYDAVQKTWKKFRTATGQQRKRTAFRVPALILIQADTPPQTKTAARAQEPVRVQGSVTGQARGVLGLLFTVIAPKTRFSTSARFCPRRCYNPRKKSPVKRGSIDPEISGGESLFRLRRSRRRIRASWFFSGTCVGH